MTRKRRYKDSSGAMEKMTAPNFESSNRSSIGMEKFVGEYYFLSIEKLIPYQKQARRIFNEEEIQELAQTIKEHGIKSPLLVINSKNHQGSFEVVSGERRLRAAKIVGLTKLPCIIIDDNQAEEVALIENIQRENLHPIELADALAKLLDEKKHGQQIEMAEKIGVSKQQISHLVAISKLPEDVKNYLIQRKDLKIAYLRKLAYLKDEQTLREKVFNSDTNQKKYASVLRLSFNGDSFKCDQLKIDKLNPLEKKALVKELLNIVESIKD